MKIQKWSYVVGFLGLLVTFISILQWKILYNDTSNFLFGFGFGSVIISFAYLYSVLKNNDEEHREMSMMQDSFLNWKLEMEEKEQI